MKTKKTDFTCPECDSKTYLEKGVGWWCSNIKCSLARDYEIPNAAQIVMGHEKLGLVILKDKNKYFWGVVMGGYFEKKEIPKTLYDVILDFKVNEIIPK